MWCPLAQDYLVRWFREDDLEYYMAGLNRTLYDRYDEERFRWKFRDSPFNLGFVSIAVVEEAESGEPVGFNSFLPLEVRAGPDTFLAVQGCDGFVDMEHRRRGLFQRTLHFMAEELRGRGPEVLIGFNFAGSTGAAQKAGSQVACDVDRWHLDLREIDTDRLRGGEDVSLSGASDEEIHDIYMGWASEETRIHFHRTPEYLRWRFDDPPLRDYMLYKVEVNGVPRGYVATSTAEDEDGLTELSIDDCIPPFSDAMPFPNILGEILGIVDDVSKVEMHTRHGDLLGEAVGRLGFSAEPEPRYTVIMKAIDNVETRGERIFRGGLELTQIGNWYFTRSDIY